MFVATSNYITEPYTKEQLLVHDAAYLGSKVYLMNTFFEVDITNLRQKLKQYNKAQSQKISLPTALLYCYVKTLGHQPRVHALKSMFRKLYIFNKVDVFFPFEIVTEDKRLIARKIIRAANQKSLQELGAIMASLAQVTSIQMPWYEKLYMNFPKFIRNIGYSILMGIPLKRKEFLGNAYFSAALSMGTDRITVHSIPCHFHSIGMFIGPCKLSTVLVNGKEETITSVCITVSADHSISNGVDLARFAKEFLKQVDAINL